MNADTVYVHKKDRIIIYKLDRVKEDYLQTRERMNVFFADSYRMNAGIMMENGCKSKWSLQP